MFAGIFCRDILCADYEYKTILSMTLQSSVICQLDSCKSEGSKWQVIGGWGLDIQKQSYLKI